jgi:hypothetical protein
MSIVVIGGHTRNIGKTSVAAGLIAALPEFAWMAIKITQYGHDVCSVVGAPCDCATADHSWAISDERDRHGTSDTSRFLQAGAARALWVRTEQGKLAEAMPEFRQRIAGVENVMIESNSVLRFLRPDLYLAVLDPATEDFKTSAQEFMDRADAVILHGSGDSGAPVWKQVSLRPVAGRPRFFIRPPQYVTDEVVQFVRAKLAGAKVTRSLG